MKDTFYIIVGLLVLIGFVIRGLVVPETNSHRSSGPAYDIACNWNCDAEPLIKAWMRAEGSSPVCNNPLNTTLDVGNGYNWNSVGVKCYDDYNIGLSATISTLSEPQYVQIVQAIKDNNPEAFRQAVVSSPWGTADIELSRQYVSNPVTVCSYNINAALNANNGALRDVTINPGNMFSFNATMGDPTNINVDSCGGSVLGAGWCNLGAAYARVARQMGLTVQFQDHGIGDIGQGPEFSVMIWNEGGKAGQGDLEITNTTGRNAHFWVEPINDGVQVLGEFL